MKDFKRFTERVDSVFVSELDCRIAYNKLCAIENSIEDGTFFKLELEKSNKQIVKNILEDLINSCHFSFGLHGKPIIELDGDFALNIAKQYGVDIK